MAREHIVSVRLTDAEYARLCRLGQPSEVLRRLIDPGPQTVVPITTCPPVFMSWHDGTFGQSYPQLATR